MVLHSNGRVLALPTKCHKGGRNGSRAVANTLAYYNTTTITVKKRFVIQSFVLQYF
jgi:hypothetical protein